MEVRIQFDAVRSWLQTKLEIFKVLSDMFQDITFKIIQYDDV